MDTIPKLMDAAVLYGPEDLRYEQIPTPSPNPDDALIQISMNGLCGSDIHFFEHGELGPFKVTKPYVPGHEASGRVVREAASGKGPHVGQRVAIEPGIPCRQCEYCKTGRYNLCPDVIFLSAPPVNGTFSNFVAIPADFVHLLPDAIDDESGAFIEPVSVAIQACNRGDLKAGDSVAIVGAGPIGLVTYLVARAYGADPIYLIDGLENRLALGKKMGANDVLNFKEGEVTAAFMELTSGAGVDVVIDASGSSQGCAQTPQLCSLGGKIILVGWPETSPVQFPIQHVLEKEINVYGVNRYCNTYPTAISLMASGKLDINPLISHRYPFPEICDVVQFAAKNKNLTMKIMISHF